MTALWVVSSATATDTVIWSAWCTSSSSTNTAIITTTGNAWASWNMTLTTDSATGRIARIAPETLAQQDARVARESAYRIETERANERAHRLLLQTLSDEQRESYEKRKFFYLYTKDRCYRIDHGTHGNVKLVETQSKSVIGSYCVQPDGVPVEDAMIAQLLHLRHDEEGFLKRANFRQIAPEHRQAA